MMLSTGVTGFIHDMRCLLVTLSLVFFTFYLLKKSGDFLLTFVQFDEGDNLKGLLCRKRQTLFSPLYPKLA